MKDGRDKKGKEVSSDKILGPLCLLLFLSQHSRGKFTLSYFNFVMKKSPKGEKEMRVVKLKY